MTVTPPDDSYNPSGPPAYPPAGPQGYGPPGPAQPGHPHAGHPQPGYPQSGYPQSGYPQSGHPQSGHPQPGHGTPPYAPWLIRVGSFLIDGLIPGSVAVVLQFIGLASGDPTLFVLLSLAGGLGALAFVIWNSGYRQGTTGQSIGKQVIGTRLVLAVSGRPTGFGLAVGRQFAHILDALPLYLGYLWPLWDERRQTFADKICATVVVRANA
jgi:uncharacterized RDD family membrane protein YckC